MLEAGKTYTTTRGTIKIREIRDWREQPMTVVVVRDNGGEALYTYSDILTWSPKLST